MKTKYGFIRDWFHLILSIFTIFIIVAIRWVDVDFISRTRFNIFDGYQRFLPREHKILPVRIIDIDDATLEKQGQWPWSRTKVAELVTQLKAMGATVIGFDAIFAEFDRTSPQNIVQLWQQNFAISPDLQATLKKLPNHDLLFAQAIKNAGNVVLSFALSSESTPITPPLNATLTADNKDYLTALPVFSSSVKNIALLEQAAVGSGSYDIEAEADSIVRRLPLLFRLNDKVYPSLVLESLRIKEKVQTISIQTSREHRQIRIISVTVGHYTIPTDAQGNIWLYFPKTIHNHAIPVWKILAKAADVNVKNCIVIIGTSATGLIDQRATPLNPFASSVDIHVNALEQIMLKKFLSVPAWSKTLDISLIIGWGLFFISVMRYIGPVICLFLAISFASFFAAVSWTMFERSGVLIDPVYASVGVLIIYFVVALINFVKTELERNNVRNAFNRYLSPSLTEQLVKNPNKLELGGEMRDMTILFCDIRGFTTISEQFDAHGLTHFINRFLTPMTIVILENQGTIDKYIGDCIMAFWNAPLDDKDHAIHAAKSALVMLDELVILNEQQKLLAERENRRFIPINIGIGLNSGLCCVGNMGSEQRFDYSVLGDDVNLASRLEGQSKNYEVSIVIGEATQQKVKHLFALLELDLIQVKGKLRAVRIFTLLGDKTLKESLEFRQLAQLHQEMLLNYRSKNWLEALNLVRQCQQVKEFPLYKFYKIYERRISFFMENPPPEDWSGVYVATEK
jgi:adenylate cyclase